MCSCSVSKEASYVWHILYSILYSQRQTHDPYDILNNAYDILNNAYDILNNTRHEHSLCRTPPYDIIIRLVFNSRLTEHCGAYVYTKLDSHTATTNILEPLSSSFPFAISDQ